MTHKCPKSQTFMHTNKCELVANSVCALTERWKRVSCHRAPWPCHCSNDSDSCHYQEEEKLKLGCESVGNQQTQKNRKQGEDSCELWLNPEGGQHWKDCGGPENQQLGLTDITRAHAYGTRLCSTSFSPSLQFGVGHTYLSQVSQCPSDTSNFMSVSIQEKPIFISKCIFYISCTMGNYMLCLNWATCLTSGL